MMSVHLLVFLLLVLLHATVCVMVVRMSRNGTLRCQGPLLAMVFFVPVFGLIALLVLEATAAADRSTQQRIAKVEELEFQDSVHRSITPEEGIDSESVVPLQEALSLNDEDMRRGLVLDILYSDPEGQVNTLANARSSDDIEVVHYATTAMVELQKYYDQQLEATRKDYLDYPFDPDASAAYSQTIARYIDSGLLEGHMLADVRKDYQQVLARQLKDAWRRCGSERPSRAVYDLLEAQFDNFLAMESYQRAAEVADLIVDKWPHREAGYLKKLQLAVTLKDSAAVQHVLDEIDFHRVHLSNAGRQVYEFWRGDDSPHVA